MVLRADQYAGGRLDWYSFDVDAKVPPHQVDLPASAARLVRRELDTLAVPLAYAGMPASRYWQFEEGAVYFGGIEAGPADLGRLLVAEFATVYSDDWFLVPVRFPIGCLARVEGISVRNTFGERHPVRSCAEWDEKQAAGGRAFAFFELSGDGSAASGKAPWLALVPSLSSTLHGAPLETVSFVRDEAANLAWAIEERIETARRALAGATADGKGRAAARTGGQTDGAPAGAEARTRRGAIACRRRYRPIGFRWLPNARTTLGSGGAAQGAHARLVELEDPQEAGAKGTLLTPNRPFVLHEEEIPRGGVQVTRRWQVARGADGSLHLWMARQKRPGRGERGSGLQYDMIDRS